MYTVQYHAHDGSDGGTLWSGPTVEACRRWWASYPHKEDYPAEECRVDIHEPNTEVFGSAVEELN